MPPKLKSEATLPCDLSLIIIRFRLSLFLDLKSSVATPLMCSGIFNNFIANLQMNIYQCKNFENWLAFGGQKSGVLFFWLSVHIFFYMNILYRVGQNRLLLSVDNSATFKGRNVCCQNFRCWQLKHMLWDSAKPGHVELSNRSAATKTDDG